MTKAASEVAGKARSPRTHRVGWDEIRDITKAWRELGRWNADPKYARRLLEDVLDSVDPRWRSEA